MGCRRRYAVNFFLLGPSFPVPQTHVSGMSNLPGYHLRKWPGETQQRRHGNRGGELGGGRERQQLPGERDARGAGRRSRGEGRGQQGSTKRAWVAASWRCWWQGVRIRRRARRREAVEVGKDDNAAGGGVCVPLRSYMSIAVDLRQERTGPAKYIKERNSDLGPGFPCSGFYEYACALSSRLVLL